MDLQVINNLLSGQQIEVLGLYSNGPACEEYIHTKFSQTPGYTVETMVPYVYRRSNMALISETEIADYLISIKQYFSKDYIDSWCLEQKKQIEGATTVKAKFLRVLLDSSCQEILQDNFPPTNNPQKTIQGLKDEGLTLSVLRGSKDNGNRTRYWLLPLPKIAETLYEKMSYKFIKKAKEVLGNYDAFEAKKVSPQSLLPDHKFSEIRWTPDTADDNPMSMSEDEIKEKFQLLTAQRNQQKREVCRQCRKTGKRGVIYGIKFYYSGDENWDSSIPEVGKEAEKGCIGCPWYDIQKWREELKKHLSNASPKV